MDVQQTNRKLSDLEYRMRTLTKDENPNFKRFNEDIGHVEDYFGGKMKLRPIEKEIKSLKALVNLFTEYIGN